MRQGCAAILLFGLTLLVFGASPAHGETPQAGGPLVVLDPGHGGSNTGAPSVKAEIREKHVTLALAGELRRRLQKRGIRVALTRTRDDYLTLRKRGQLANQWGADLFVSLHTNATESHAQRGYETFVLTPRAVEVDGRALRGPSNKPRGDLDETTAAVLDDIETSTSQPRAVALAAAIQTELRTLRGTKGDRGVRQDAMHVLLGVTMPAVLVEIGFIDHPIEGPELLDPARREAIAEALAKAIASQL